MRPFVPYLPGVAVAIFNAGWDMIGYQNPTLGFILWAVSAVLILIPAAYWLVGVVRERNQLKADIEQLQTKFSEVEQERERLRGQKELLDEELGNRMPPRLPSHGGSVLYPSLQDQELGARYFKNRTIYIADLARELADASWVTTVISSRAFEDCRIYGPAVLVPLSTGEIVGKTFDNDCKFMDGINIAWLGRPEEHPGFVGTIGLEDCVFRKCRFEQCGVLVSQKDYDRLRGKSDGEPELGV